MRARVIRTQVWWVSARLSQGPPDGRQQMSADPTEVLRPQNATKTYRYLRVAMIGAVVFLTASIMVEKAATNDASLDCWQTSVSGYYYTPVRAAFVGALIAVGFALIVYKGRDAWEDSFLNAAGMLLPVVAIARTTNIEKEPGCWSLAPESFPTIERTLPDGVVETELAGWVTTIVDNNFDALL
jgi:hypothetical protein